MVYTQYKQKLEKVVNALNVTWRFKYLIICGVVLILALILSLCGISGNIYGDPCPEQVEYGTCISEVFKPKAILASAKIEYKVDGEWTEEEPVTAGTYTVRAASRGAFGTKYSDEYTCTITKYTSTLNIDVDKYQYGNDPEVSVTVIDSDIVVEYGFEYEYIEDDTENVTYEVTATVEKIVNENGEDVTSSYYILPAVKQLTCVKREITISTGSDEVTYDGAAHSKQSYSITSEAKLVDGQEIDITYPEFVDVGSYSNQPAITVYDGNGDDVTFNYHITYTLGTVEIIQRDITITIITEIAEDGEPVTYDADPHNESTYDKDKLNEDSLVSGHEIVITPLVFWTDAGEYAYSSETTAITIVEGENDVTSNYKINVIYGTLTIEPRSITVYTASREWVYDGEYHWAADEGDYGKDSTSKYWVLEEKGHTLAVDPDSVEETKIKDVTDSDTMAVWGAKNALRFNVLDADGNDVTSNYSISVEEGNFRIKNKIIISLYSYSKYYDGIALNSEDISYTVVQSPPDVIVSECTFTENSITDVGVLYASDFKIANIVLIDSVSPEDSPIVLDSENTVNAWEIEQSDTPVLEIKPREIEITSISVEVVNTGKTLTNKDWWFSKLSSLAEGHTIDVTVTGVLSPTESSAVNTFSVVIYDSNGNEVTENYSITKNEGTLSWLQ